MSATGADQGELLKEIYKNLIAMEGKLFVAESHPLVVFGMSEGYLYLDAEDKFLVDISHMTFPVFRHSLAPAVSAVSRESLIDSFIFNQLEEVVELETPLPKKLEHFMSATEAKKQSEAALDAIVQEVRNRGMEYLTAVVLKHIENAVAAGKCRIVLENPASDIREVVETELTSLGYQVHWKSVQGFPANLTVSW
jgi:hypothetical protein